MTTWKKILILLTMGAAVSAFAVDTATTWTEVCAKCHGADGKGDTKMGHKLSISDLTDPKVQAKFTDEEAFKSIKSGRTDDKGKTTMKPAEGVTDADITALVAYVRALKK